jgi:hypothetical protein
MAGYHARVSIGCSTTALQTVDSAAVYNYPLPPVAYSVTSPDCTQAGPALVGCPVSARNMQGQIVLLTINGDFFGRIDSLQIGVNDAPCINQAFLGGSAYNVTCQLPSLVGLGYPLILVQGDKRTRSSLTSISYAPPSIMSVRGCPTNLVCADLNAGICAQRRFTIYSVVSYYCFLFFVPEHCAIPLIELRSALFISSCHCMNRRSKRAIVLVRVTP